MSGTFPNYFLPNLGLTPTFGVLPLILVFWALFCYFHVFPLIFVIFTQNLTKFVTFRLTPSFLVSGTFPNYFLPNLGLTPNFWGLTFNFSVLGTFLLFSFFPLIFVIFTQNLTNFVTFCLTPNFLVSGTFPNYFLPNLGLTPIFWGLTLNFSVLGTFLLFSSFSPNFWYFYPKFNQFRDFLSYPQLLSVWDLSQLFSTQFRPYPQLLGSYT